MSDELLNTLKQELKKFYFKNFKRRGKSLKTLELIKECYNDQFDFYIQQVQKIINKSIETKDEKTIMK